MPADRAGAYGHSMSADTETFDIPIEVAELYEERFVPAIFAEWAPMTLEAVGLPGEREPGDRAPKGSVGRLLDVACGTGIVARTARQLCGPDLDVWGVDLNPAMLTVAGRVGPDIEWRQGDVVDLPFEDGEFDAAVCQMAAMFFPDVRSAYAEMARVVRPGGQLAWMVPSSIDEQPVYGPFVDIAVAHTDESARNLLGAYWNRGDREAFTADLEAVGLEVTSARARVGTARFDSPATLVDIEIDSTPLTDRIGPKARAAITEEVTARLADYVRPGQPFEFPLVGNIMAARKPA